MEMEEFEKIDDLSSPGDFQFSENLSDPTTHDTSNNIDAVKQLPKIHEITEPEISQRSGRYILRKSLAWDSAFFTSGGVLDPQELSTMLKGTEKSKRHLLPGIEEDITVSTESISNLESDNLAVDCLETDLFVDIRASIQRSSKKASNLTNSSIEAMETDNTAIPSLKKEELVSQNKNTKSTFKKISSLQTIRTSKNQPKPNIVKLGSGKAVKQDSGHSRVTQIGESKKPLTPTSKHIPLSTAAVKRDSMGSISTKSECGSSKLVSDKGTQPSKVSSLTGARRPLPKPALSSKSSLLGSSTTCREQSTKSCTLRDSSSSISSKVPAKSSLMAARRNLVKGDAVKASTGSMPKTPSRTVVKKTPVHTLSAYLMSTKITSSALPNSSISEWSSASSSSSSSLMVNQGYTNSRISPDISSCRSMDNDAVLLDTRNHFTDQIVDGHKSYGIVLPCNSSTKSSTHTGAHQAPKQSGLRMPSPTIGFFDGVKSLARPPNGDPQSQFGLHGVIPNNTVAICSPPCSPNINLESGKTPIGKIVTALINIESDSPENTSSASFQDTALASGDNSRVLEDKKDFPILPLEVKGGITSGENCSKARKLLVENGAKQAVYSGPLAIINEGVGDMNNLNMQKHIGKGDVNIDPVEGINPLGCIGERVDEDRLVYQNYLQNHSYPICKTSDKENGLAEDQGEGLRIHNEDVIPHITSSTAEIFKAISDCASLSLTETASRSAPHRSRFTLKNVFCNNDFLDISKESACQAADKTVF